MANRTRKRERPNVPSWRRHFVEKYQTDLIIRINRVLEEKGWSQQDLRKGLEEKGIDWSKARVSQVLSGDKNLTLETISKIEDALGEDILEVPLSEDKEQKRHSRLFDLIEDALREDDLEIPLSENLEQSRSRIRDLIREELDEERLEYHITARWRSLILQVAGSYYSQEGTTESSEAGYSYGSYR